MALRTGARKSKPSDGKTEKATKSKTTKSKAAKSNGGGGVDVKVQLVKGDITQIEAPVVVVGHYKGVAPIKAVGALDKAMGHWISQAGERGMIGGNLGELFFIPVTRNQIKAQTILLGGMGDYGEFSYDDLRYLSLNIAYAISALQLESFACVTIGAGDGGLTLQEASKGLISGICDALHNFEKDQRILSELILIERDADRFGQLKEIFNGFAEDKPFENVNIKMMEPIVMPEETTAAAAAQGGNGLVLPRSQFVNRITIEQGKDGFQFSALTNSAVVPVRRVEVQRFFTDGIADRLRSVDVESQEKFGRLLHHYLFPEDFERLISGKPLTLVLDSTTASLPWEMACFGPRHNRSYFGTHLKLTRQFRTALSAPPGIAPPVNKSLRFLVIADPADNDVELALPSARKEGEVVVNILRRFAGELKKSRGLDITVEERIGAAQCRPVDILELIMNETFDVIHFAGHGIFDYEHPNRSGWVFRKNCVLSAREIFRVRQVPRLVFANACFSAVCNVKKDSLDKDVRDVKISIEQEPPAEEANKRLAGLAEAFFERGVHNYIGTGWPVVDDPAATFAEVFYEKALTGDSLSESLAAARNEIFDQGSTWGAYQHYGQSTARLVGERD